MFLLYALYMYYGTIIIIITKKSPKIQRRWSFKVMFEQRIRLTW